MIDVSYGVLHYNPNEDETARNAFVAAVDSLAANRSDSLTSEVYIIDQGNPHSEIEVGYKLAKKYGFNFVSLDMNVGISRGINWLAHIARGQYISLVTSDTIFTPGLDESLIGTLSQYSEDIWMICPASDQSDYEYQRAGWSDGGVALTIAQELTIQFWPRHTFEKIGYFDEQWKACYENMDYALRIFLAGGYAAVSHEAFCPHDAHMCVRSGARNQTYNQYMNMPDGFNQELLVPLWDRKWPDISKFINLSEPLKEDYDRFRGPMKDLYGDNFYLPYIQEVNY